MMNLSLEAGFALNVALLLMLISVGIAIATTRSLLAAILLMGIYSLVSAVWLVVMDAADVAFTEAVVGAGVSTIILLGAMLLPRIGRSQGGLRSLALVLGTALLLVPSPLLELRYLNLPVLLARLMSTPLSGAWQWAPPLLALAAVNAASLGLFLGRPYVWGDGTIARFMW